ncbi:DUF3276 family protein [Thermophagus sp. OGC60D27]|uniref:DUF3276 family protein n=1 Tax=Thermophagus sp. OGC60D27 TaxID=3458415 RepID=UPI00403820D9
MEKKRNEREDIFSKVVRAGKRTYFFDVKATRKDDYYLTITESKKRFEEDGRFHFEKHKLFLYKEDFEKFSNGLKEVIDFIQAEQGVYESSMADQGSQSSTDEALSTAEYTNVDFEDLNQE